MRPGDLRFLQRHNPSTQHSAGNQIPAENCLGLCNGWRAQWGWGVAVSSSYARASVCARPAPCEGGSACLC